MIKKKVVYAEYEMYFNWQTESLPTIGVVSSSLLVFLPFVRRPQHFSKHLQLAELSPKLAEATLLVKLREGSVESYRP